MRAGMLEVSVRARNSLLSRGSRWGLSAPLLPRWLELFIQGPLHSLPLRYLEGRRHINLRHSALFHVRISN